MVRYAGVSNFVGWQTAQAVTWQNAFPGRAPIVSAQVEYSLLARRAEVEVIPAVRAFGLGLLPWSPIGRGVLTGKYRTGIPRGSRGAADHFSWFVEPYLEARSAAVVAAVAKAADGLDLTPAQVALLWVRDAPGVTALPGHRGTLAAGRDRRRPGRRVRRPQRGSDQQPDRPDPLAATSFVTLVRLRLGRGSGRRPGRRTRATPWAPARRCRGTAP